MITGARSSTGAGGRVMQPTRTSTTAKAQASARVRAENIICRTSCESGKQRNESYRVVGLFADAIVRLVDHGEPLNAAQILVTIGQGQNHSASNAEVPQQSGGDFRRRRGDDDAIDFQILAEIVRAVAVLDPHILDL